MAALRAKFEVVGERLRNSMSEQSGSPMLEEVDDLREYTDWRWAGRSMVILKGLLLILARYWYRLSDCRVG